MKLLRNVITTLLLAQAVCSSESKKTELNLRRKLQDDAVTDLIITGVIDGPLSGGLPKAIEVYACSSISDLSVYGLGGANNGGGTDGEEFTFPSESVEAGQFLYVASEADGFEEFFGFPPTYTSFAASINGDDAIELFKSGQVVDLYGDIDVDGTGEVWDHLDGWSYRSGVDDNSACTFNPGDWVFSGPNALDDETTNAAAVVPFPIGTYEGVCPTATSCPTPAPTPEPEIPFVKIHDVQGDGSSTPLFGQTVSVEAIVIGDFQNDDGDETRRLNGFWIQEEDADVDADPMTSEGLFVFFPAETVDVKLGDKVLVTGTAGEFFGQTQISADEVLILEELGEEGLPTPATIVLDETGETPTDLEPYEGMLVVFDQELFISEMFNLDRFNEIKLFAGGRPSQFTQTNMPDVEGKELFDEQIANRQITYDDGLGSQNENIGFLDGFGPVYNTETAPRMGDFTTNLNGVLSFSFGVYRVRSVKDASNTFQTGNPRPLEPPSISGAITMSCYNVLNFFTTLDEGGNGSGPSGDEPRGADSQFEFDRQVEKLVTNLVLLDADVLAFAELENNFIPGDPGNALEYLVGAINENLAADVYAYVDPRSDFVDVSDVISVGIMYKKDKVQPIGIPALLTDSVLSPSEPIFDGQSTNRATLATSFKKLGDGITINGDGRRLEGNDCFTLAVNHWKSKGCGGSEGANEDQGDGAGCYNDRRLQASKAVVDWLESKPTGPNCIYKAIAGDLNAYAMEDPIQNLVDAGYVNVEGPEDYSYVFDGQIGTLDYIFVNGPMAETIQDAAVWHINEDEADALDYNTDFGRLTTYFDGSNPARSSDHSPVIIGFDP